MDEQYGQLIEPSRVPFTFGAPGWYVLAVLLLLVFSGLAWFLFRRYKKELYRRQAEKELGGDIYATNMLLKRVAMAVYQRNEVAGLRKLEWIDFLNKSRGKELFSTADSQLLEGVYTNKRTVESDFTRKAKEWIIKHKR